MHLFRIIIIITVFFFFFLDISSHFLSYNTTHRYYATNYPIFTSFRLPSSPPVLNTLPSNTAQSSLGFDAGNLYIFHHSNSTNNKICNFWHEYPYKLHFPPTTPTMHHQSSSRFQTTKYLHFTCALSAWFCKINHDPLPTATALFPPPPPYALEYIQLDTRPTE